MGCSTFWYILIFVAFVVFFYRYYYSSEGFNTQYSSISQEQVLNPTLFQPNLVTAINDAGIQGLPTNMSVPWQTDANDKSGQIIENIGFSLCSNDCCSKQYPLPFDMPVDKLVQASKTKFIPNSSTCNNGFQKVGCSCIGENETDFLIHRGNNA